MLSTAEIAAMRADIESLMPGTAVIYARQATSDGAGGRASSWTAAGTVAARLDYEGQRGREVGADDREESTQYYVLTVPHATTVTHTGQVVYDGTTYEVIEVLTEGPWDICQRVRLQRVQ